MEGKQGKLVIDGKFYNIQINNRFSVNHFNDTYIVDIDRNQINVQPADNTFMDVFNEWLKDNITITDDDSLFIPSTILFNDYKEYITLDGGNCYPSARLFKKMLVSKGIVYKIKYHEGRTQRGYICLKF